MPSAANLNLYRGRSSHVGWHSDDEPLFGERGEAKLIVSVSFGAQALFKWKGKSCPSNGGRSCWLDHGDILVMDGQCQDEFYHCTDPGSDQERINITFRWVKQHVASCSFLRTGVACCLPTCSRGFSFSDTGEVGIGVFGWFFGFFLVLCASWEYLFLYFTPLCVQSLGIEDVPSTGHALWAEVGGGIIFVTPGKFAGKHEKLPAFKIMGFGIFGFKLYMLALVGRPSLRSYDACTVYRVARASRRNCRQNRM